MQNAEIGRLLPQKAVAADFGCCVRTLADRANTDPDFPKPIIINSRRYYSAAQIGDYKQLLLTKAMAPKPPGYFHGKRLSEIAKASAEADQ
jgi:hypothetical protein